MPTSKKPTKKPVLGQSVTRRLSVKKLNPAPYNPRVTLKPGDPEWKRLDRSLTQFGLVEPLVWNERTGNLVGGHQRLAVLKHRGAKTATVTVVDLSPPQEKALNVALNKITGRWDDDKLAAVLDELHADDSIDELLSGFDADEIEKLLPDPESVIAAAGGDVGGETEATTKLGYALEYRIVVKCVDEKHQGKLMRRFAKEGITCKALIA